VSGVPPAAGLVRLLAALERAAIAGLMAAITILTFAQVVWRYGFDQPLQWSEEVARYAFVWVTFLGASTLLRLRDGHPAIDTLYLHSGPRLRRAMDIFGRAMVIACCLAIAAGGLRMMQLQWKQLSPSLELPMVWVYLSMTLPPLVGIFWVLWCAGHGQLEDEG